MYPPFFTSVTSKLINRLNIKDKTQRPKNYADRFSVGDFWREIYVTRLWKRCKNARWLNLRVPSFVQKCRNQHWNKSKTFLLCKWRTTCPILSARLPNFRSVVSEKNVVAVMSNENETCCTNLQFCHKSSRFLVLCAPSPRCRRRVWVFAKSEWSGLFYIAAYY